LQTAQVFPGLSLINPLSPQVVPHEFFILQYESVTPTKRTPWLTLVEHPDKTPDLYDDQIEASTATEIGLWASELAKLVQAF